MSEEKPLRKIRSFVRREGRITKSQENAIAKCWPKYGLGIDAGKLDFTEIFGRTAPVTLEIGFGMGDSLIEMAQAAPDVNFIGIEVHRPGVGSLLANVAEKNIENLRVFCHDAVEILEKNIPDESLDKILIFFPDPWHKKRHNKRRLIQPAFVNLLVSKLKSSGQIHLATDWQDYAEQMLEVLSEHPDLINVAGHGQYISEKTDRPRTKFERRGERLGHGVWDLMFAREK